MAIAIRWFTYKMVIFQYFPVIYIISLPEGKHWNILKPFGVSAIPAAQVQMSQCRNGLTGKPNGWGYPQIIIHIFFLDSTLNKPSIWGTPILGNIHLYKYIRKYILHTYNYIYIFMFIYYLSIFLGTPEANPRVLTVTRMNDLMIVCPPCTFVPWIDRHP